MAPAAATPEGLCHLSPVAEKIARFRSLFRGRDDVYARRFENPRSGKCGYSPACGNEWVRGTCEKPRVKCSDCPNPCWLAVSDEVVHAHLAGCDEGGKPLVMGLYPMLRDETCSLLAVDFDGEGWRDRRKDVLLQQHGYFILRFLATDAGKHLDAVLDAILSVLTSRMPSNARVRAFLTDGER